MAKVSPLPDGAAAGEANEEKEVELPADAVEAKAAKPEELADE